MDNNNNRRFEKMYDLNPEDWKVRAAVIVETDLEVGTDRYVHAGDMTLDQAYEHYTGKCQHCNHNHVNFVVMQNKVNGDFISIGWQCYNETFSQTSKVALDMHRAKKEAEAHSRRKALKAAAEKYRTEHGELVAFVEANSSNRFFSSLLDSIKNYGSLTERQEEAAYMAMQKMQARKAEEATEVRKPAPKGKVSGQFKVLSIKWHDDFYGSTLKMTVKHTTDNWRMWVTVPSSISFELEVGDTVQMNVNVTPNDNDEFFAFGKRPTKAEIVK